jgi:hypothetical protein
MSSTANELWNGWRSLAEIRELAEGLITKPEGEWSPDDEALYAILRTEPDRALSVIFAAMQLTEDQRVLGGLAAGPLEDFLGAHGKAYLETFHTLALEHRRLREVLNGVWQGAMTKTYGAASRHCSREHSHEFAQQRTSAGGTDSRRNLHPSKLRRSPAPPVEIDFSTMDNTMSP